MSTEPNHQDASASPDGLDSALSGASVKGRGVRRLNRVPLLIILGLVVLVLTVVFITMYQKSHHAQEIKAAEAPKDMAKGAMLPQDFAQNAPTSGEIAPAAGPISDKPAATGAAPATAGNGGTSGSKSPSDDANSPNRRAWDAYYTAEQRVLQQQQQEAMEALAAKTSVPLTQEHGTGSPQGAPQTMTAAPGVQLPPGLAALAGGAGGAAADPNKQADKRNFLKGTAEADYLNHTRTAELTPYDIKAGTVIPATMISGLNSDLPGQIIAQVTENVYDTATGMHLIIPQGSKLVGTYDNGVTLGQTRALVAWKRVIFPDASSLDLDLMVGADQSGYSGFADKVNNHYWRIFGNAAVVSLFSAGIQLSQPQATNGENITNEQVIAASLGQQMGQLGMEIARRNMDIQPTIIIRPGYVFNVMISKDLVLPPWGGAGTQ